MFLGDYHTHTTLSHGKGSIEDNVISAIKAGLKEIAITDHGFGHGSYAVKRKAYEEAKKQVAELNKKYEEINILLGLECNLITAGGEVDLKEGEMDKLDIMVCGFHKLVKTDFKSAFGFCLPNLLGKSDKKTIVKNTDAYLKLLDNYEVDIISHLNYAICADAIEVGKACARKGTYLELNGKRVNLTDAEIERLAGEGVTFIIGSDAHRPEKVADMSVPMEIVKRLGIPSQSIANLDKLPSFRSRK